MTATHERPLRTAEVIAVGSELLGSTRLDTNSLFIAERLVAIGIELRSKFISAASTAAETSLGETCAYFWARR